MSTSLPQEVQTNKVNTLPDDLKAIAEAMLADKFGVKEVVTERGDSFPDNRRRNSSANAGCGNSFCATCYDGIDPCGFQMAGRPGYDPRFGNSPSHGIRTTLISLEGCYEALRRLERDVGPSLRRGKAEWRMGRRQFDDLTRDRRFDSAGRFGPGGPVLFNHPVLLQGDDTHEIELVYFY